MKHPLKILILSLFIFSSPLFAQTRMMFGDTSRRGVPFSKDPHVIRFKDKYLMYFSLPPYTDKENPVKGWGIGIAESDDLVNWKKTGELHPQAEYEKKGLCAPCALVIDDTVHLFYQTYGNGKNDAICHAKSSNGIEFTRNTTNRFFKPTGEWTVGRAIDAEVTRYKDRYLLYFATRDPEMKIQMLGVAGTDLNTSFNQEDWQLLVDKPILEPLLPWEQECIEGASIIERNGILYMFYAGAYNNRPQQVGVAVSKNGTEWKRLFKEPFLSNGDENQWNSSESGHPHIFSDADGKTYLFFQGNNDKGKTWYISQIEVRWNHKGPYLAKD